MRKFLMALVVLFSCCHFATAQSNNDTFTKGSQYLNIGLGLPSRYVSSVVMPPILASYENCLKDNLFDENSSLGVGAATSLWKGDGFTVASLGARGALHYAFVSKLDTYVGLQIGIEYGSVNSDVSAWGYGWDAYLGARYLFKPTIGGFLELGYNYLGIGASFRL